MDDISLGVIELFLIVTVFSITVAGPVVVIAIVLYYNKRKNTSDGTKKCPYCAYSIPLESLVCGFCARDLPH